MPLSKLNTDQYKAATAPLGNNLIIASAGTGKTSTIVARIAHLLQQGIKPTEILLLTFTNKAATEMIERLERYFKKAIIDDITAGTFHSVSYKLLKKLDKSVTLKQPSELKTLLRSIAERRRFDHISDIKPYGGAYLFDIYSLYSNKEINKSFYEWFCQNYDEQAVYAEIYEDIIKEFESEKAKFGYVGFNDLLLNMRRELKKGAPLYFTEILVDEYQDTNSLQGSLIDAFNKKSLFCVGDFDQSIYAFNGANIDIIGSFDKHYKNAQIYALNTNYRSSSTILALANKVIQNNPRLYEKKLVVSREGVFKAPTLLVFDELYTQYQHIASMIKDSKFDKESIAVIFRNNSSADGIEASLKEQGISSKRKESGSFFESREIKALINLVGILLNPKDVMAFMGVFEYSKGVGSSVAKEVYEALNSLGNGNILKGLLRPDKSAKIYTPKRKSYQLGLFDEFDTLGDTARFSEFVSHDFITHPALKYEKLSSGGAVMLDRLYEVFSTISRNQNSTIVLKKLLNSRAYGIIANELATKRATMKNGKVNQDLLTQAKTKIYQKAQILINLTKNYSSLESFYNFLTLGSSEMGEGKGVNLLSVHASKGLEFAQVFIVDLAQNRFPNTKLMAMGGSVEEERRLFYVAVTRARDELVLSYAKYDKIRKVSYEPSQFLVEAGMVKV
ncbi:ATP-dependent helicase [Campylobacter corcagiensis]|uniref:DNA 3'-5' helicase n=1 Tax=Campylobacter corcagiensis TaxID=1448857 RepID=A0A7M1LGF3_9BACT|nr:ATP-dependent helicase [Campylobacter corcagiensis]QKF64722.1 ATP-dependent DNA helicase [Campylobacter corcagiensis]QOQ87114.1 ATP-dependent helicase [Campylobacter corcagiensis]